MTRHGHYTKHTKKNDIPCWKVDLINIAKDLCYPAETIAQLRAARNEIEGIRVMTTARNNIK